MIDHLDTMLFRLFRWQVSELTRDGQVRFQPPDEDWRALVRSPAAPTIRSMYISWTCARTASCAPTSASARIVGSDVYETPPPRRVDCHYLISAWSPVLVTPGIDPTFDEHALLAEVARVLGQRDVLDPVEICAATRPPGLARYQSARAFRR